MDLTRGERIADLRKERGLTVEQLADIVGVSKGTISNLENDKSSNVKVDFIIQLANYFNVTTDYLLGLSNCKKYDTTGIGKKTGLSERSIERLQKIKDSKFVGIILIELIINNDRILDSWADLLSHFKTPESDIRLVVENYINNIGCGLEEFSQDSLKRHLVDSDCFVSDKDFKILFSFVQNYLKLCDIANADVIEGVQLTTNQDIGAEFYYLDYSFKDLVHNYINKLSNEMENCTLQEQKNHFSDTSFDISDLHDDTQTMINVLENCIDREQMALQTLKVKEARRTETKANSNKEGDT